MADHDYFQFVAPDWDVLTAGALRIASDQKRPALDPELIGEVHFAREAADRVDSWRMG